MEINKVRFIEPGNRPYKKSIKNLYVYDRYIRTPSIGLLTLATIMKEVIDDTLMYSESISKIRWDDVLDSDVVFIGIFTFNANRGYELADYIRKNSNAVVVMGGLHASMNYKEACEHCDYVMLGEGDETILEVIAKLGRGESLDMPGIAYIDKGKLYNTGKPVLPASFETIPDRNLVYNYKKMAGHNTVWPQVHASRGCPHNCDYCALVRHFGRTVRTRSPQNVLSDIRRSIAFHEEGHHRLAKVLWITDDNFFADRDWAMQVLRAIIESDIEYHFTIQARYEVGFDDEMLELLKRAGFTELALGIEFLEDEAFDSYNKKSTYREICSAVKNIQKHGIRTRGLFIVGADNHTKGVGDRLADFVINYNICGALIQSMYFVPGTPVYEKNKDRLIHENWSLYNGNVVHYPEQIAPYDLQNEIIRASKKIYSFKRLVHAVLCKRGEERMLFIGEFFWQRSMRSDLRDVRDRVLKKGDAETSN